MVRRGGGLPLPSSASSATGGHGTTSSASTTSHHIDPSSMSVSRAKTSSPAESMMSLPAHYTASQDSCDSANRRSSKLQSVLHKMRERPTTPSTVASAATALRGNKQVQHQRMSYAMPVSAMTSSPMRQASPRFTVPSVGLSTVRDDSNTNINATREDDNCEDRDEQKLNDTRDAGEAEERHGATEHPGLNTTDVAATQENNNATTVNNTSKLAVQNIVDVIENNDDNDDDDGDSASAKTDEESTSVAKSDLMDDEDNSFRRFTQKIAVESIVRALENTIASKEPSINAMVNEISEDKPAATNLFADPSSPTAAPLLAAAGSGTKSFSKKQSQHVKKTASNHALSPKQSQADEIEMASSSNQLCLDDSIEVVHKLSSHGEHSFVVDEQSPDEPTQGREQNEDRLTTDDDQSRYGQGRGVDESKDDASFKAPASSSRNHKQLSVSTANTNDQPLKETPNNHPRSPIRSPVRSPSSRSELRQQQQEQVQKEQRQQRERAQAEERAKAAKSKGSRASTTAGGFLACGLFSLLDTIRENSDEKEADKICETRPVEIESDPETRARVMALAAEIHADNARLVNMPNTDIEDEDTDRWDGVSTLGSIRDNQDRFPSGVRDFFSIAPRPIPIEITTTDGGKAPPQEETTDGSAQGNLTDATITSNSANGATGEDDAGLNRAVALATGGGATITIATAGMSSTKPSVNMAVSSDSEEKAMKRNAAMSPSSTTAMNTVVRSLLEDDETGLSLEYSLNTFEDATALAAQQHQQQQQQQQHEVPQQQEVESNQVGGAMAVAATAAAAGLTSGAARASQLKKGDMQQEALARSPQAATAGSLSINTGVEVVHRNGPQLTPNSTTVQEAGLVFTPTTPAVSDVQGSTPNNKRGSGADGAVRKTQNTADREVKQRAMVATATTTATAASIAAFTKAPTAENHVGGRNSSVTNNSPPTPPLSTGPAPTSAEKEVTEQSARDKQVVGDVTTNADMVPSSHANETPIIDSNHTDNKSVAVAESVLTNDYEDITEVAANLGMAASMADRSAALRMPASSTIADDVFADVDDTDDVVGLKDADANDGSTTPTSDSAHANANANALEAAAAATTAAAIVAVAGVAATGASAGTDGGDSTPNDAAVTETAAAIEDASHNNEANTRPGPESTTLQIGASSNAATSTVQPSHGDDNNPDVIDLTAASDDSPSNTSSTGTPPSPSMATKGPSSTRSLPTTIRNSPRVIRSPSKKDGAVGSMVAKFETQSTPSAVKRRAFTFTKASSNRKFSANKSPSTPSSTTLQKQPSQASTSQASVKPPTPMTSTPTAAAAAADSELAIALSLSSDSMTLKSMKDDEGDEDEDEGSAANTQNSLRSLPLPVRQAPSTTSSTMAVASAARSTGSATSAPGPAPAKGLLAELKTFVKSDKLATPSKNGTDSDASMTPSSSKAKQQQAARRSFSSAKQQMDGEPVGHQAALRAQIMKFQERKKRRSLDTVGSSPASTIAGGSSAVDAVSMSGAPALDDGSISTNNVRGDGSRMPRIIPRCSTRSSSLSPAPRSTSISVSSMAASLSASPRRSRPELDRVMLSRVGSGSDSMNGASRGARSRSLPPSGSGSTTSNSTKRSALAVNAPVGGRKIAEGYIHALTKKNQNKKQSSGFAQMYVDNITRKGGDDEARSCAPPRSSSPMTRPPSTPKKKGTFSSPLEKVQLKKVGTAATSKTGTCTTASSPSKSSSKSSSKALSIPKVVNVKSVNTVALAGKLLLKSNDAAKSNGGAAAKARENTTVFTKTTAATSSTAATAAASAESTEGATTGIIAGSIAVGGAVGVAAAVTAASASKPDSAVEATSSNNPPGLPLDADSVSQQKINASTSNSTKSQSVFAKKPPASPGTATASKPNIPLIRKTKSASSQSQSQSMKVPRVITPMIPQHSRTPRSSSSPSKRSAKDAPTTTITTNPHPRPVHSDSSISSSGSSANNKGNGNQKAPSVNKYAWRRAPPGMIDPAAELAALTDASPRTSQIRQTFEKSLFNRGDGKESATLRLIDQFESPRSKKAGKHWQKPQQIFAFASALKKGTDSSSVAGSNSNNRNGNGRITIAKGHSQGEIGTSNSFNNSNSKHGSIVFTNSNVQSISSMSQNSSNSNININATKHLMEPPANRISHSAGQQLSPIDPIVTNGPSKRGVEPEQCIANIPKNLVSTMAEQYGGRSPRGKRIGMRPASPTAAAAGLVAVGTVATMASRNRNSNNANDRTDVIVITQMEPEESIQGDEVPQLRLPDSHYPHDPIDVESIIDLTHAGSDPPTEMDDSDDVGSASADHQQHANTNGDVQHDVQNEAPAGMIVSDTSSSSSIDADELVSKIDNMVHRLIRTGRLPVSTQDDDQDDDSQNGNSEQPDEAGVAPRGLHGTSDGEAANAAGDGAKLHKRTLRRNTAELLQNLAILRSRRAQRERMQAMAMGDSVASKTPIVEDSRAAVVLANTQKGSAETMAATTGGAQRTRSSKSVQEQQGFEHDDHVNDVQDEEDADREMHEGPASSMSASNSMVAGAGTVGMVVGGDVSMLNRTMNSRSEREQHQQNTRKPPQPEQHSHRSHPEYDAASRSSGVTSSAPEYYAFPTAIATTTATPGGGGPAVATVNSNNFQRSDPPSCCVSTTSSQATNTENMFQQQQQDPPEARITASRDSGSSGLSSLQQLRQRRNSAARLIQQEAQRLMTKTAIEEAEFLREKERKSHLRKQKVLKKKLEKQKKEIEMMQRLQHQREDEERRSIQRRKQIEPMELRPPYRSHSPFALSPGGRKPEEAVETVERRRDSKSVTNRSVVSEPPMVLPTMSGQQEMVLSQREGGRTLGIELPSLHPDPSATVATSYTGMNAVVAAPAVSSSSNDQDSEREEDHGNDENVHAVSAPRTSVMDAADSSIQTGTSPILHNDQQRRSGPPRPEDIVTRRMPSRVAINNNTSKTNTSRALADATSETRSYTNSQDRHLSNAQQYHHQEHQQQQQQQYSSPAMGRGVDATPAPVKNGGSNSNSSSNRTRSSTLSSQQQKQRHQQQQQQQIESINPTMSDWEANDLKKLELLMDSKSMTTESNSNAAGALDAGARTSHIIVSGSNSDSNHAHVLDNNACYEDTTSYEGTYGSITSDSENETDTDADSDGGDTRRLERIELMIHELRARRENAKGLASHEVGM